METALFVLIVVGIGAEIWLARRWRSRIEPVLISIHLQNKAAQTDVVFIRAALEDIQNAIEVDAQLKARQPQPIKPPPSGPLRPRRFPTIASRRAQAEAESMGAITHSAEVRQNNTKAMEAR